MSALARLLTWVLLIRGLRGSRRAGEPAPPARRGPTNPSPSTGRATSRAAGGVDDAPVPTQRSGEPGPDTPLDLAATDWRTTLKRTGAEIKDDRVTLAAAGMAYYF